MLKADVKEGMKYLKNEFLLNAVYSWCDYNYIILNTKKMKYFIKCSGSTPMLEEIIRWYTIKHGKRRV